MYQYSLVVGLEHYRPSNRSDVMGKRRYDDGGSDDGYSRSRADDYVKMEWKEYITWPCKMVHWSGGRRARCKEEVTASITPGPRGSRPAPFLPMGKRPQLTEFFIQQPECNS